MRHLILTALALAALWTTAAADCGMDHDGAHAAAADQPSFDDWRAAGGDEPLQVLGVLSRAQVQAMRDAHAAAGLALDLTVVPAGGVNAGKFYVSGALAPEMYAAMAAAHDAGGLALEIREAPPGVVAGYRDDNDDTDLVHGEMDADMRRMHEEMMRAHEAAGIDIDEGDMRKMHRKMLRGKAGKWRGQGGKWQGRSGKWRDKPGARGWRGERGNYDRRDHCGHWEQDWHQDGCGSVHVHNLADWLPHRAGWSYGFPYGGWDDDSWPHVRGDGSQVWYTGEFWRNTDVVHDIPAWFDAHWVQFGEAYPDTFWLSASPGPRWAGRGCGHQGCKSVNRCNRCAKWQCGCGHHKCGCH